MGNNRLGSNSDVEKLARQARRAGFDVFVKKGSNHVCWLAPLREGEKVRARINSPLTFGDQRRIKQIKKFLLEHGVENIHL